MGHVLKQQNLVSVGVINGHKFSLDSSSTSSLQVLHFSFSKEKTGKMSVNSMHWFCRFRVKRLMCVLAKKATLTWVVLKNQMMDEWVELLLCTNKSVTLIVYTWPSRSSGSLCTQIDPQSRFHHWKSGDFQRNPQILEVQKEIGNVKQQSCSYCGITMEVLNVFIVTIWVDLQVPQ